MDLFIYLLITYSVIENSQCSDGSHAEAIGLEIQPESMANGHNMLTRKVEDTLNLTCTVISNTISHNHHILPRHKLSWHLPHLIQQNSQHRVSESEDSPNSRVLTIQNLKESDTGDYECRARLEADSRALVYNKTVRLNVKNRKSCGENMFMCPAGNCIGRRFVCDGKSDCKSGEDESEDHCGLSPCDGKLWCPDKRCIPLQWCCDLSEPNCTAKVKHPCCQRFGPGFVPAPDFSDSSEQQRFNDMGFLQTTIYTVIGCAMAFMFIVTILVIAICRVHMKRSLLTRCPRGAPRGPGARGLPQQVPLYDLDVFLNRAGGFPQEARSGLLVTYNINNGIQFVGRPVDPPPYCEVVASPPREGPPPPYASRESLLSAPQAPEAVPLLSTADNTLRITVVNSVPRTATIRLPVAAQAGPVPSTSVQDEPGDDEAKPQSPTDISRHDDLSQA